MSETRAGEITSLEERALEHLEEMPPEETGSEQSPTLESWEKDPPLPPFRVGLAIAMPHRPAIDG